MLSQVWSTVTGSDGFTKFILLLILFLSIGSWAVAIAKLKELRRIMSASRVFMEALRTTGRPPGGDFVKNSGDMGPLARMYTEAGRYLGRRKDQGREEPLNRDEVAILHSALEREASEDLAHRSRNLGFLATVTSVSPLLGLLGTVWGVLASFIAMREAGVADISAVGAGVAAGVGAGLPQFGGYVPPLPPPPLPEGGAGGVVGLPVSAKMQRCSTSTQSR